MDILPGKESELPVLACLRQGVLPLLGWLISLCSVWVVEHTGLDRSQLHLLTIRATRGKLT